MPVSYGAGTVLGLLDNYLMLSLDVYRTHWDDYKLEHEANRKPTTQIRFGAEYLLFKKGRLIPLRSGIFYDPEPAEGWVDDIFGVAIQEQADIVIASAGGYPKDINLYQSQKTIDNAVYAMKPGGVVILLAECPDIKEPSEFFDWFNHPTFLEMEQAVRANFLISGWVAVRQLEYGRQGTIIMVTRKENIELAHKAGVQGVTSMEEALKLAYETCGSNAPTITVMPQGANTFPILNRQNPEE